MEISLVLALALILFAGFVGGATATKLRQPPIVGYLFAGVALGAFFYGNSAASVQINILSEISLAFLFFILGLQLSLESVKKFAVVGVSAQLILVTTFTALLLSLGFKIPLSTAIFAGCVVSISSGVVVHKVLGSRGELESTWGELITSWIAVYGLAVIPLMLIVPTLTSSTFNTVGILLSIVKSLAIIYLMFLLGKKTIPLVFNRLALFNSREVLLVAAIFIFCAVAFLSSVVGLNAAVGAYIAGVVLAKTAKNNSLFTELFSLSGLFSCVFFVSIGALILLENFFSVFWLALLLTLTIFILKFLTILVLVIVFKYHSKIAFLMAFALFQVGEFSLILAKSGFNNGVLSTNIYRSLVLTCVITLVLTPFIYGSSSKFYKLFKKFTKAKIPKLYNYIFKHLDSDAKMPRPRNVKLKNHVIVIGYGGVGAYLGKLLSNSKTPFSVIDINYKVLTDLRRKGISSVYGDAENKFILKAAGLSNARCVVVTPSNYLTSENILKSVLKINPDAKVFIRSDTEQDIARLSVRGVKGIIQPEFEAGIEIGKKILSVYNYNASDVERFITIIKNERRY